MVKGLLSPRALFSALWKPLSSLDSLMKKKTVSQALRATAELGREMATSWAMYLEASFIAGRSHSQLSPTLPHLPTPVPHEGLYTRNEAWPGKCWLRAGQDMLEAFYQCEQQAGGCKSSTGKTEAETENGHTVCARHWLEQMFPQPFPNIFIFFCTYFNF